MGSLNNSHSQDGGIVLFSGELILLYCDAVHCEVKSFGHVSQLYHAFFLNMFKSFIYN